MNWPRKLVHHGCCANYYFSYQRKYQNLFKRNRKFERAYKQLSKRYNALKSQNTEIVRQLQEQKVLNRRLEKELHAQNSVWMNHATSMEHVQMKQLIATLNETFANLFTHTVELTKHMSNGKSAIENYMRNDWFPNNRRQNNDLRKPASKTAPIRPMVQGYTVHQPSIFLQRCNVPSLEEDMGMDNQMENDSSDRLSTIFEENSDADSSPVSTNMMQESINLVENCRRKKSRLGRLACRSSSNCGAERALFGGNSRAERNGSDQEELQDSAETFSVMSDVINIRRSSGPFTTSPNFIMHTSSHCNREPVVKLHKLSERFCTSPSKEYHQIIEEEEEEEHSVANKSVAAAAASSRVTAVDPLEGSSWMYANNYTPNRADPRNISYVIDDDDDDDDDDDVEIVRQPETNISQIGKSPQGTGGKAIDDRPNRSEEQSSVGVAINATSESVTEFTGFDNDEIGGGQSLDTLNRLIDNMQHNASDQNGTHENGGVEVMHFDASVVEEDVKIVISSASGKSSPKKTGCDDVNTEVINNGSNVSSIGEKSSTKANPTSSAKLSARQTTNLEQNTRQPLSPRQRSPAIYVIHEPILVENGNMVTEEVNIVTEVSSEEDDVPIDILKKKLKPSGPRKRSAGNNLNGDIGSNIDSVESGLESEPVEPPPRILVDCSTITKRRRMKTTPGSNRKNDSSRENSHLETPKESIGSIVSRRLYVSLQRLSLKSNRKLNAQKNIQKKSPLKNNQKTNGRKSPTEKRKKSSSQNRRKKKVSQESIPNSSTASNFDEFGFPKQERSRRNKAVPNYKEISLSHKLRRSK